MSPSSSSSSSSTMSSSSSSSSFGSSSMADVAIAKQNNLRQALESLHSQSTSLLSFSLQWKDLESYFTSISDAIVEQKKETELKLKQVEWRRKFLDKKATEIELRERKLEERLSEIDATYELVEMCYEAAKRNEKRFDEEFRKLKRDLKRKFEEKELRLEAGELRIDNLDHEFIKRKEKLGFIERKLLWRLEEVELKEKRFDQRFRELEKREKILERKVKERGTRVCKDVVKVKIEPLDDELVDPSYADIKINVSMDGRALQVFLNGRVSDHEILRGEISTGLKLSSDPAKLVLDAMLGFYPEDLEKKNGDVGFDLSVVRKSCVLLLEELVKMKPRIKTRVRERAMRVAVQWKGKLNVGHCLEVVGFLWLVATYGLSYGFNEDELLMLFEDCACHNRAPELFQSLGLPTEKIHGVIQNLIIRDQPFAAIRLIYAFELVDMFRPAPILKAHLASTIAHAEQTYNGNPSVEAEIKCISMKLAALVSVVKCIREYGLECNYPVQPFEDLISELKMQKSKCKALVLASMAQENTDIEKLCISSTTTPISSSVKESTSLPVKQICLEPTGLKSRHCSAPTNTEPLTPISDGSYAPNSYRNRVSPLLATTMISPKSVVDPSTMISPKSVVNPSNMVSPKSIVSPEHNISKVGSPSTPKIHPQNMTQQNTRPRLASVITSGPRRVLQPFNPYLLPYESKPTYTISTRGHNGYYAQRYYPDW